MVVVVQTDSAVSAQGRIYRALDSKDSTGCQCHHLAGRVLRLSLRQHVAGVRHSCQGERKGWVAHPPHPSVAQILEGSTFAVA